MSVRKYNLKRSIRKVGIIFENDYYFDEIFIDQLIENLNIRKKNIYLMNFGKNFFEFDYSILHLEQKILQLKHMDLI